MSQANDSQHETMTFKNLLQSFNQEAGLYFKLKYFQTIAEYEGRDDLSKLYANLADLSKDQVLGSLDFLRNIRDPHSQVPLGFSDVNLKSIQLFFSELSKTQYPEMAHDARIEGFTDIASWFDTLEKIKRAHLEKVEAILTKREN